MTKKHFEHAAQMVREILEGNWTHDAPVWLASYDSEYGTYDASTIDAESERNAHYTRAVQTAEAFVILFTAFNPRFDSARFLRACGFTLSK